jgi:hypothetical protein
MKMDTHSIPTITSHKHKRPADEHDSKTLLQHIDKKQKPSPPSTTPRPVKPTTKPPSSKSTLVPRGPRKKATIGHKDESLLRMLCDCTSTQKVVELHFRKIPHSIIDWTSAPHISAINAWRNQIYGRAGLKARSVSLWHEAEELWFEVYFQLSIVEARKRGILLPATRQVRDAFNKTFVGRVIRDRAGRELPPRVEREGNAFASKFSRVVPLLRARLNACVFGVSGDVYVPEITLEMLERYKVVKREMADKGIECESEDADGVGEWQDFLSRLEDGGDGEVKENAEEQEESRDLEAKEVDAAAALISLANSPVNSWNTLLPAVGGGILT